MITRAISIEYYILLLWSCMAIGTVLYVSSYYVNPVLIPKWIAFFAVVIAGLLLSFPLSLLKTNNIEWKHLYKNICRCTNTIVFIEVLIAASQRLFGIFYFNCCHAGTFDNVAGLSACIVLTYPMGFAFFEKYALIERVLFLISKFVCLVTVLLYGSRIGIICLVFSLLLIISYKHKFSRLSAYLFLVVSLPLSASLWKAQSTSGRWFILRNTIRMISERPLTGWGVDGFRNNYMNVQANYFSTHTDTAHALVAGNIHHPLNEYLHLAVNYGIPVCLLIVILIFTTFFFLRNNKNLYSVEGMNILQCACVLSFFSYPFSYPFTWSVVILALFVMFYRMILVILAMKYTKRVYLLLIALSILYIKPLFAEINFQLRWKNASNIACFDSLRNARAKYEVLRGTVNVTPRFLYNYACEAFDAEQYEMALELSESASLQLADYELQMLLADSYNSLHKDSSAIKAYTHAHYMCPSRVAPCYEIYMIYSHSNDTLNCQRWYHKIKKMPIKVENTLVKQMISEIIDDFNRYN